MAEDATPLEDLESFRKRARAWLADNMPRLDASARPAWEFVPDARTRLLQRKLFDGGLAGLCFPKEYGGQSLSPMHQRVFNEECAGYQMPTSLNTPTLTILAPTLVDFGTEAQKKRHLPAILRGEELWVQFLSEPTGGSDLAGSITRATPQGDAWVLNGSKIWSSSAHRSDYAMCLARTDWDVPKHQGLTMFIVEVHQPRIVIEQIKQVNGSMEFCQEFFDDVPIPAENVVGEVNDGWTVASRLLFHERNAVGGGSIYASSPVLRGRREAGPRLDLVELARYTGQAHDERVRQLVAEAHVLSTVHGYLIQRVTAGMRTGHFSGPAGALLKLFGATAGVRRSEIGLKIAGTAGIAWREGDTTAGRYGAASLGRQGGSLAGGSNEIQRNIISERVLEMPREFAADRDVPFNQVKRNKMTVRNRG